jgi:hypothetical protein
MQVHGLRVAIAGSEFELFVCVETWRVIVWEGCLRAASREHDAVSFCRRKAMSIGIMRKLEGQRRNLDAARLGVCQMTVSCSGRKSRLRV